MPGGWLVAGSPVWLLGVIALLLRGLFRGAFLATWDGLLAAFSDLGPALKARADLKRRRKVTPWRLAKAFTWNPFAYLGRSIDVRRFPEPGLTAVVPMDA